MSKHPFALTVHEQSWPLDQPFQTARGASTEARIVVTVNDGQHTGRGEGAPISRYGQNVALATVQLEEVFLKGAVDRP